MCAIYGYLGKGDAGKKIKRALETMEYRGYDSWGIGVINENDMVVRKEVGSIRDSLEPFAANRFNMGIGHNRWATHGGVTQTNAHPHTASDSSFMLVQNGIVENYKELKADLSEYMFVSETDTEVIVHLIEKEAKHLPFEKAVFSAFRQLKGRNTIVVLHKTLQLIIAIKNGSPLIVGRNNGTGELALGSDTLSLKNDCTEYTALENFEAVILKKNYAPQFISVLSELDLVKEFESLDIEEGSLDKGNFENFMLKEIYEQKDVVRNVTLNDEILMEKFVTVLNAKRKVFITAAGSAYYAALQIAYYLRTVADIPAFAIKAYEMANHSALLDKQSVVIAVSQSGETADTIEAIEFAQSKGAVIASIVNMVGSTTSRMSEFPFYTRSGPEVAVASTKAFTAQVTWGYYLSMCIVQKESEAKEAIDTLCNDIEYAFEKSNIAKTAKNMADSLVSQDHVFILGKGLNYAIALEGALKSKEIAYKHFEGFASGELKHGVIALIDKGTPVICICSDDADKPDVITAAKEVESRGARVIMLCKEKMNEFEEEIVIPNAKLLDPVVNTIFFQLLAYYLGMALGLNIDKPRNLAKSVTVK